MATMLRILAFEAIIGATLFAAAGRWDLPWFWAIISVHAALMTLALSAIDPDLRRERFKPGPGGKDRYLRLIALPFILAHLIVAGLDVGRFHWSRPMPTSVQALALISYAAAMALSVCAMTNNRFFSPVVRIQHERGHTLVTSGPYRFVRHPGYLGAILASICGGVALGSWWSLVPLVPFGVLFLRRTSLEDQMLRADLSGYVGYAERERYRLVQGSGEPATVWTLPPHSMVATVERYTPEVARGRGDRSDQRGRGDYCEQTPPSTGRVWPVTYRASSESSQTTGSAMSSGWPIRPIGTKAE